MNVYFGGRKSTHLSWVLSCRPPDLIPAVTHEPPLKLHNLALNEQTLQTTQDSQKNLLPPPSPSTVVLSMARGGRPARGQLAMDPLAGSLTFISLRESLTLVGIKIIAEVK